MTAVRVLNLPIQRSRRVVEVLPPVERSTDRLLFRPLAFSDRARVLAAVRHSREALETRIPLNRPGESDDAMFDRWVRSAADTERDRTAWRRAAFLPGGAFVGLFNLIRIEFGFESVCEANWWVDRRFTGRGYATEGVTALAEHALSDRPLGLGLDRIGAMIQPANGASARVAEKAGFRPTGRVEVLPVGGAERRHLVYERRAAPTG